jgi:hypothetical protein
MDWTTSAQDTTSLKMAATLLYIESIVYPDHPLGPLPKPLPPRQTLSTRTQSASFPLRDDLGQLGDTAGRVGSSGWDD